MIVTLFIQKNIFNNLPTERFLPPGCGKLPQSSQQRIARNLKGRCPWIILFPVTQNGGRENTLPRYLCEQV